MRVPPGLMLQSEPLSATSQEPADETRGDVLERGAFLGAAGLVAALYLGVRAWALVPSWFYADDHRLLGQAQGSSLGPAYLLEPFDSQFMPFGRAIAWLVSHDLGGNVVEPSWATAVTVSLLLATGVAASSLWMLTVAFGPRWEVLVLYVLALASTTALPAAMWWAASLNQLPLLIVWSSGVAAGLRYLQTRRAVWIGVLVVLLALGFLAYVKTVVIVVVLAYLAIAYFARGSLRARVVDVATSCAPAVAAVSALAIGFMGYYVLAVPSAVTDSSVAGIAGPLADRLLGTSWAAAATGGPWRWDDANAPVSITDPPDWAVHLSWVVIALVVAYSVLRRSGTGRGWGLVVLGLLMDYALLLTTRAPGFGAVAGNEMRYLTEASLVLALGLGLVFLPLRSALDPSRPREAPLLRVGLTPLVPVALVAVVVVGSLASTVTYVRTWHTDNPGRSFVDTVAGASRDMGRLELVDTRVPDEVMSPLLAPYNTVGRLVPIHVPGVEFPPVSTNLFVLSDRGAPVPARIAASTTSQSGEVDGCGWRVRSSGLTIPLREATLEYDWWLRIGYLGSQRTAVTVTAGDVSRSTTLNPGIGSLFVNAAGEFDEVRLSGLTPGATLCVDVIEVGTPEPGETS